MHETVGEMYRKTTAEFLLRKTALAVGVGQPLSKKKDGEGGMGACRQTVELWVLIIAKIETRGVVIGTSMRHKDLFSFRILHLLMAQWLVQSGGWREGGGVEEERRGVESSVPGNSCPCNLYWWGDRHGRELPAVWSLRQSGELVGGAAHPCGSGWTGKTFWTHTRRHF